MIGRLAISAVLTGVAWFAVISVTELGGGERLFVLGLIAATAGYHRELFTGDPPSLSSPIQLPTESRMRIRYRLWGVPLAPPRRIQLGHRARERAHKRPGRARMLELLPVPLASLLRRVLR